MSCLVSANLGRRRGAWVPWAAAAAVAWGCLIVSAQVQYQPPVQQNGRLFDRNPQLGSGGYNAARPVSPLIMGNALTTGNMRGGMSFRGFSPINDPTAFRGSLGSTSLSAFRRDSVSAADTYGLYSGLGGTPYYDPSRTVATGSFLSGQYTQPAPQVGPLSGSANPLLTPGGFGAPLDLRLDTRVNVSRGSTEPGAAPVLGDLRSQIVGLRPAAPELSSSIFGPKTRGASRTQAETGQYGVEIPFSQPLPIQLQRDDWNAMNWQRRDLEDVPGSRPPLGTPLEAVQSDRLRGFPIEPGQESLTQTTGEETALVPGPLNVWPEQAAVQGYAGGESDAGVSPRYTSWVRDASILPGYDVFTDMQLALSLAGDPGANWFEDMQAAIRKDPQLAPLLMEQADMQSREFVDSMLSSPIQTFHGRGESPKNNEVLKAESLMELGRYYEAVRRYDAAHRMDPLDPLPLLGKANALLGAGDYRSASLALVQGFERYPELTQFSFDLSALIGGREIIDIRRADLLQRLDDREDPRLRFLLGYLEYYAGDTQLKDSALENFEKAAQSDRDGTIISRFPALLRGEGTPPPPKLPGVEPLEPEEIPGRDVPPPPRGRRVAPAPGTRSR